MSAGALHTTPSSIMLDLPALHVVPRLDAARFDDQLQRLLRHAGIAPVQPTLVAGLPGDEAQGPTVYTRIGAVQLYIDRHVEDVRDLAQLAAQAQLSKYHFSRCFREVIGQSPWAYVQAARLRRAKALLHDPDRSLTDVALDAGFYDQSHFIRAFKQAEGVTPGAYREAILGADAEGEATQA